MLPNWRNAKNAKSKRYLRVCEQIKTKQSIEHVVFVTVTHNKG